ncbi:MULTISPECIES: long-chain-fatty-acid--CoA ligase [Burkholderia]|uniref:Long-chain-fatty-acid--CoA ligase n=1 Tax=Burkholderia pseudomultivorans TaxID=1207504 RepID=A0ABU2EDC4_9BURK|nr:MULTISPECIES: long-chain-fatty-acid--CoA ligase [Burkholderia]MDR8731472.1 Long-chain-fatty-acid--CoA ligase [Burkholderia pseudomultivorans]MDR8738764.1 Long-chain-fatty-acid--CoA ligase [Burkholderia pseudomultivorans]MDR8745403.1 Long-chain-fatty-acid--CoA ligase [Burkholderia pseudomultivorans]MDR8757503.1 Long-chain-fatty-acid--CoA ligase [Burkholderia pseudomultivorans]MDR8781649.1 Long-chain-fatty-acid--CoA ligase [Burkholderia pseudomultivorans]
MQAQDIKNWPHHLPHRLTVPGTNLYSNLFVSAQRFPEKAALICEDVCLSYRELLRRVDVLASFLYVRCGLDRGARVVLYMQNSPEFIVAYYAALRIGAIVVTINPMNRAAELAHFFGDADAEVIVCDGDLLAHVAAANSENRIRHALVAGTVETGPTAFTVTQFDAALEMFVEDAGEPDFLFDADQPALILYSSGTTGLPKGCVHSHRSLMASVVTLTHWMWIHSDAVVMLSLPLFHITAMQNQMNAPIYSGATMVMLKRWNRERAADLVHRYRVTHLTAMPTMITDLLGSPQISSFDFSSLSRIGGGGAQMSEGLWARIKETWGIDFLEGYGLSETAHVTGNPADHPRRQCLGVPLFNVDLRVVDADTLVELPANEVGEIVVSAPQVFLGYWRNPEATQACFFERDGRRFFRTGDLGYYDADGYFYLKDRLKRMVNASGYKVWPSEVEAMLYEHPAVHEACVIAASDPYRGETVKAVIVLRQESSGAVSADDIISWSRERMAAYKYPRIVEFVDALPRSPTGKIDWRRLQESQRPASPPPPAAADSTETP